MIEALESEQSESTSYPFGEYQEEAIISMVIDHPEFCSSIAKFLNYTLFQRADTQYVMAEIIKYYEKFSVFPTRGMLLDCVKKTLTVDKPGWREAIALVERKSDPRELPAIKEQLIQWARAKSYGLLYDPETMQKYYNGDFEALEEIITKAHNIQDIGSGCMWFFRDIEKCFIENSFDYFTTGFPQLDSYMHKGEAQRGPVRKEVFIWMAPTGKGKSLALCNNAIANLLRKRNVLYITLELSDLLSAIRMLGVLTNHPIDHRRFTTKDEMMGIVNKLRSSGDVGELVLQEFPPDETSVDAIYALVDHLKRTFSWTPDIIIIDYLELMVSRRSADNDDDYTRQKNTATQIRGLAKNTDTLVFTATQTNRSSNEVAIIDVTKIAESYGKTMSADYLVSINQTAEECVDGSGKPLPIAPARLFVAKNRNGDKGMQIPVEINYATMRLKEIH